MGYSGLDLVSIAALVTTLSCLSSAPARRMEGRSDRRFAGEHNDCSESGGRRSQTNRNRLWMPGVGSRAAH